MIYTFAFKGQGIVSPLLNLPLKRKRMVGEFEKNMYHRILEKDTREASQFLVNVCNVQVSILQIRNRKDTKTSLL